MQPDEPTLDDSFAIKTPEDAAQLYRAWAPTFDRGFADRLGYRLPEMVAEAFVRAGGLGPVLDVGAGTGLVGARLGAFGAGPLDGIDLSPEMLAEARRKEVYRRLIQADLTLPLDLADATYGGVVASGIFTHGHLGPQLFGELLRVAAPGAVFALSVNAGVYVANGFQARFTAMAPQISGFSIHEAPIYDRPDPEHADQRAQIVVFRKV